jgi:hypothetical protein
MERGVSLGGGKLRGGGRMSMTAVDLVAGVVAMVLALYCFSIAIGAGRR